jgi:hypothetical protein
MMSSQSRIVKILVSSPSDVTESEIEEVKKAAHEWNQERGQSSGGVHFDVVVGADRTHSELRKRPQEAVTDQVVSNADCVFAIFADRLGTPTGKSESGTVEEINFAIENEKNVSVVRSLLPRAPKTDLEEARELVRLLEYLGGFKESALILSYSDENGLYMLAQRTFRAWARDYANDSIECGQAGVTQNDLCADQRFLKNNPIGSWLESVHGEKVLKLLQDESDTYPGWFLREVKEVNDTIDMTLSSINDADIKNALSKLAKDLNNYEYVSKSILCPRDGNEDYYVICQERTLVQESSNEPPFNHSGILHDAESDLHAALSELRELCNNKLAFRV